MRRDQDVKDDMKPKSECISDSRLDALTLLQQSEGRTICQFRSDLREALPRRQHVQMFTGATSTVHAMIEAHGQGGENLKRLNSDSKGALVTLGGSVSQA